MQKRIKMKDLAQAKHVKFLMLLEKQSKAGFELVLKKLFFAIGKSLRKDGLAKSEDLIKGMNGDWQKEGYTLHHQVDKNGDHKFLAKNSIGNTVGYLNINRDDFGANDVSIHPDHQRKGLASGLYNLAEKKLGISIVPSDAQTDDGAALWS